MDNINLRLTNEVIGEIRVQAKDVAKLARIAHEMRARLSDPRIMPSTKGIFAETIEAVDELIKNAGSAEE